MNPRLGIFLTEDTAPGIASLPLSMHLYLYAWANSINRIDPSGLQQPPPKCDFGDICSSGPTGPYVDTTPWIPPLPPYPAWQYYNEINSRAHEFHIPPIVLAGALNNQAVSPNRPLEPLFVWWYARLGTEMGFPHSYGIAQIRLYEIPDLIGRPGSMNNYAENVDILCRLSNDAPWGIELMARKLSIVQNAYLTGRCGDDGCQPGEYDESELYALLALAQNTGPREGVDLAQTVLQGISIRNILLNYFKQSNDSGLWKQMVGMYGQYVGLSSGDPILYPSYKWDLPDGVADSILQLLQDTDPNNLR